MKQDDIENMNAAETADRTDKQESTPDTQTTNDTTKKQTPRHQRHRRHENNNDKVQELGEKLALLNDKYMRTVAEYENYRKRTSAEKADLLLNGGRNVLKSILPVVDDLERALQAMSDENSKEGVTMIYNKMISILQQNGLKAMDVKGAQFDESIHEAVTQIPASEAFPKGTVVDVVEKGYYLNDKVLRYAKVVVAM